MTIKPEFFITLKQKPFVLYAGLLDAATGAGLKELSVRLLQVPTAENGQLAIAEATALFEDGRRFVEIGDAGPQNLSPAMAPSACRMAATRSKARVLRDALNVGVCSFEELPPEMEEGRPVAPAVAPTNGNGNGNGRSALPCCETCERVLLPAQAALSQKKHGRLLCPDCQRIAAGR